MAQNVIIAGASYSGVPAIDVPKSGGGTARFIDPAEINATLLATLDADFVAGNIKKDVDLFGLVGTLEGGGGDILGHKFVAGSFTLAADTTSTYTVLSANDLLNGIKDDFPGATNLSAYFYPRGGSTATPLTNFLAGICWLDEIDYFSTTLNVKEWVASFLSKYSINSSNNSLMYSDAYGNFAARSGSSNGLKIDTNGATIGFSSSYQGYAGRRYKYLIYALDHGEKFEG